MEPTCPIPISRYPVVTLAHGGGGLLMHTLIRDMFRTAFANDLLSQEHDGAFLPAMPGRAVFTTDSFVVQPLFFPGGDIGKLAVCGTVNDLAMCGAQPRYLSLAFILEEGLPMESLWRIVQSIQATANEAGVRIVTGDTKVVDNGKGDGVFINTSGLGEIIREPGTHPGRIAPGDAILVSGDLGRHGMAIMAVREGLEFESSIVSDCAPLNGIVQDLLASCVDLHCLRDLTRGGLATTLVELAGTSGLHMEIDERAIPVDDAVQGACEMLGLDPFYVANEGRFALFLPAGEADAALQVLHRHEASRNATIIGGVQDQRDGTVLLKSRIGPKRILDMLSGEQLPRIC